MQHFLHLCPSVPYTNRTNTNRVKALTAQFRCAIRIGGYLFGRGPRQTGLSICIIHNTEIERTSYNNTYTPALRLFQEAGWVSRSDSRRSQC